MKKNKLQNFFIIIVFSLIAMNNLKAEMIVLSSCENKKDGFLKNEYILDLKKSLMTRNFVYNDKTFKKLRITDLSVKKKNTTTKFIYKEDNKILTDKIGYPQFYTQILFEKGKQEVYMKTVLNDEEGISKISTCKKIEKFDSES